MSGILNIWLSILISQMPPYLSTHSVSLVLFSQNPQCVDISAPLFDKDRQQILRVQTSEKHIPDTYSNQTLRSVSFTPEPVLLWSAGLPI